MKIHKNEEGVFAQSEIKFGPETDTREIFTMAAKQISNVPSHQMEKIFSAIDLSRSVFLDIFQTEDNFRLLSTGRQKAFAMGIREASKKAVNENQLLMANGFSLFIIWLTAIIFNQDNNKEYIETELAKLRNKHSL